MEAVLYTYAARNNTIRRRRQKGKMVRRVVQRCAWVKALHLIAHVRTPLLHLHMGAPLLGDGALLALPQRRHI